MRGDDAVQDECLQHKHELQPQHEHDTSQKPLQASCPLRLVRKTREVEPCGPDFTNTDTRQDAPKGYDVNLVHAQV